MTSDFVRGEHSAGDFNTLARDPAQYLLSEQKEKGHFLLTEKVVHALLFFH